jgi:hypothetical protein
MGEMQISTAAVARQVEKLVAATKKYTRRTSTGYLMEKFEIERFGTRLIEC